MQQFTVPQFIDVEDKIIGPVTTRQFIILMVGFIFIAICYKFFDFSLFAFTGSIILLVAGTLAFLRINGRPFHFFILNVIQTLKKPGLRLWNNHIGNAYLEDNIEISIIGKKIKKSEHLENKAYSKSRLAELALIVDTKGVYRGEKDSNTMDIKTIL